MGSHPAFPGVPAITGVLALTSTDGTSFKDFYTASNSGYGVLCGSLRATSSDTAAVTLQFARNMGGTDYAIGEAQVPAGAGTNGAMVWKDVLADINTGSAMTLAPGETLRVKAKSAVTAGVEIDLIMEAAPL